MESMKMLVGLVLFAAITLPALASFERDVITAETVRAVLKKTNPSSNMMLNEDAVSALTGKTLISGSILQEALLNNANHGENGIPCGESCVWIPCFSAAIGCSCRSRVCYRNSLPALDTMEKDVITSETLEAVLKTNDADALALANKKTIVSKTVLEEAFLNNVNHGENGIPCGESCVWIPCFSAAIGCSCRSKVCYRNSLALDTLEKDVITSETLEAVLKTNDANAIALANKKTIVSKTVLEEAFLNNVNHGENGIPCGESCVWIPCLSSAFGCSCRSKVCYRNSLALN